MGGCSLPEWSPKCPLPGDLPKGEKVSKERCGSEVEDEAGVWFGSQRLGLRDEGLGFGD